MLDSYVMEDLERHNQQLLAVLLQEFQSPLVHIANQASLMNADNADEISTTIQHQAEQLLTTIDSILSSFRDHAIVISTFDIRKTIQHVVTAMQDRLDTKSQTVLVKSAQRVAHVAADPHLTYQMLYNLLENAHRSAASETTLAISIRVNENHIAVLIRDQAPQLSKQDVDRAFTQAGTTAMPLPHQPSNSGLRLFVARRLAQACGGSLSYAPSREGNCLVLRLPTNEQLRLF